MPAQSSSRRIVIVEDNDDCRESLHEYLTAIGHSVSTAADGPGGLQRIEAEAPDVALIDVGLPGFDGYELARRLRDSTRRPFLIALTGHGDIEDRQRAIAAGFDAHITKPVNLDALDPLLSSNPRASNM